MKCRVLGRTGLEISEIGFGSWAIGGNSYGTTSDQESLDALACALDHGVNFIDTADIYGFGKSEELIGRLIKGRRDQVVIATKGGWDFTRGATQANYDPKYIQSAIDASLKRLRIDTIDLYQLHNPPDSLLENRKPLFDLLRQERKKGKIRFIGVSIYVPKQGIDWVETNEIDSVQCIFNLLDQRVEKDFLPHASEKKVGIIAREPLYCGILSGKYSKVSEFPKNDHRRRWTREKLALDFEKMGIFWDSFPDFKKNPVPFSLAFVLSNASVSAVIPGAKTPEQVFTNLSASGASFDPKLFEAVRKIYQSKEIFSRGFYRQ